MEIRIGKVNGYSRFNHRNYQEIHVLVTISNEEEEVIKKIFPHAEYMHKSWCGLVEFINSLGKTQTSFVNYLRGHRNHHDSFIEYYKEKFDKEDYIFTNDELQVIATDLRAYVRKLFKEENRRRHERNV